jgi:hypothetical protein
MRAMPPPLPFRRMDLDNRRRDQRTRISLTARIVVRGGEIPVEMVDASVRGLFLRMDEAPPIRQLLKLAVDMPSGTRVYHAVVVRIVEDQMGHAGVGLRFFALNGENKSEWESFIAQALLKAGVFRAA